MAVKNLMNKSFLERTISGVVLVIIALITIISGGLVLDVTLAIVSIIGLTELLRVYKIESGMILYYLGIAGTIAWYVMIYFDKSQYFDIFIISLLVVVMAVYVFSFPRISTRQVMVTVFGVIYVSVMLSYIYQIRMSQSGAYKVWLVFLCSWGSDTCAYLAGVMFGKHKLAPMLSPKKTIEGLAGGIAGAAILGLIYATIFKSNINFGINPQIGFPLVCALGSLVAVVGDLSASAIKRKHDVKDYGHLIPGHGGILDRFDSVIFTAPMIAFLLMLF